jgi:hypothetical protein
MVWTDAKNTLAAIQQRHFSESGKIIQKLLALTLLRLGYDHLEERSIQGVDIDVMNMTTGEKHSFEVKTSKSTEIVIAKKDSKGLKAREEDGYQCFYAILCSPLCFSEGWIIVPAGHVSEGKHMAMGLLRKRNKELSEKVNHVFPEVLEEVGPSILACPQGRALAWFKEKFKI